MIGIIFFFFCRATDYLSIGRLFIVNEEKLENFALPILLHLAEPITVFYNRHHVFWASIPVVHPNKSDT